MTSSPQTLKNYNFFSIKKKKIANKLCRSSVNLLLNYIYLVNWIIAKRGNKDKNRILRKSGKFLNWHANGIPIYWNVSMLMTSITGQTTLVGSSATLSNRGSSQSALHSQWESRKVKTPAVAASAPRTLDLIRPSRFSFLITLTLWILESSSPSSAEMNNRELCVLFKLIVEISKKKKKLTMVTKVIDKNDLFD